MLLKAIATLILALVFCVGSIYAWFMINKAVQTDGYPIEVVEGFNIALDLEMITANGKKVENFNNLLPGDVLILKLAFHNFSGEEIKFKFAIKQVKYAIYKGGYPYDTPDADPIDEIEQQYLLAGVSMLNVFKLKIDRVERLPDPNDPKNTIDKILDTPFEEQRLINVFEPGNDEATVLENQVIGGFSSSSYNVTFKFTDDILDANGNAITEAFLASDKDKVNPIPIAINTFQKQNFHIGIMQVIEPPTEEGTGGV